MKQVIDFEKELKAETVEVFFWMNDEFIERTINRKELEQWVMENDRNKFISDEVVYGDHIQKHHLIPIKIYMRDELTQDDVIDFLTQKSLI